MNFMSNLRGLGKSLFDDVEKTLGRVTSQGAFIRVVQASYLIARADGTVADAEKAALQKVLAKKFPHFKAADIIKAIADTDEEFAFTVEGGIGVVMANIAKAANTDEAPVIMVAVLAVANADGEFDEAEKLVARKIADRLGLTAGDYGL